MPAKKKSATTTRGRTSKKSSSRTRAPRREQQVPLREEPSPEASPFTASPFTPGMAPECLMCPFGLFFFTMRNTRPEVMEHLTAAGHELFLAFRALVEQTGERWEQAQSLQRITVR
jgi:hypothetical protein